MFFMPGRVLRRTAALSGVMLATGLVVAGPSVADSDPQGPIGTAVAVASAQDLAGGHPYDVSVTPTGTAYIAWIGRPASSNAQQGDRTVNLCTVPASGTTCSGGVQTVSAQDSSATDLHTVATPNGVEIFWYYESSSSGYIGEADAAHGLNLGPEASRTAPVQGQLLDARLAPSGLVWTVSYGGSGRPALQVDDGAGPTTLAAPFRLASGVLAFAGSTAILAVDRYGSASTPANFAFAPSGGKWSPFAKVTGTWADGDVAMVHSGHGVRLLTGVNNSSYRPVIVPWTGTGFGAPHLTSDHSSAGGLRPNDGSTDPSGRVTDATWEGNLLTVSAYPDGRHAAVSRLKVGGTTTYTPQIGETTRGIATVVWSREHGISGSDLYLSRFRLATVSTTRGDSSAGGRAVITGPVSCLPVSNTPVKLTAHPDKGWSVRSRDFSINGHDITADHLDGASLAKDTSFTLHGSVVFEKNGVKHAATPSFTFRTC